MSNRYHILSVPYYIYVAELNMIRYTESRKMPQAVIFPLDSLCCNTECENSYVSPIVQGTG